MKTTTMTARGTGAGGASEFINAVFQSTWQSVKLYGSLAARPVRLFGNCRRIASAASIEHVSVAFCVDCACVRNKPRDPAAAASTA